MAISGSDFRLPGGSSTVRLQRGDLWNDVLSMKAHVAGSAVAPRCAQSVKATHIGGRDTQGPAGCVEEAAIFQASDLEGT